MIHIALSLRGCEKNILSISNAVIIFSLKLFLRAPLLVTPLFGVTGRGRGWVEEVKAQN